MGVVERGVANEEVRDCFNIELVADDGLDVVRVED